LQKLISARTPPENGSCCFGFAVSAAVNCCFETKDQSVEPGTIQTHALQDMPEQGEPEMKTHGSAVWRGPQPFGPG